MRRSGTQFVTAEDGTSIAYWTVGSGPPVVLLHAWNHSHAELEWEIPSLRSFYEKLAERHQVVRMDPRSTGLSGEVPVEDDEERFTTDVTRDVEIVADALGHRQFDVIASGAAAPVGVRLATTDRIGRLVLFDPSISVREARETFRYIHAVETLGQINRADAADVMARFWVSLTPAEEAEAMTTMIKTNHKNHPAMSDKGQLTSASPWLANVIAPTLIVYTRDGATTSLEQVQEAASTIPDARLVGVNGSVAPYWVDRHAVLDALGGFLGWEPGTEPVESGVGVIVFTDIVASTEVIDLLGDEAARDAVRSVEDLVAGEAAGQSGQVVKHLGDGSLLEFRSASNALDFARKVQQQLAEGDIGLRVGMAAGEPIREDGDVHGAVVVVASRIAATAGAGEVLVSEGVRQLVVGKQYDFDDTGEQSIKGFDEPIRVWRLSS